MSRAAAHLAALGKGWRDSEARAKSLELTLEAERAQHARPSVRWSAGRISQATRRRSGARNCCENGRGPLGAKQCSTATSCASARASRTRPSRTALARRLARKASSPDLSFASRSWEMEPPTGWPLRVHHPATCARHQQDVLVAPRKGWQATQYVRNRPEAILHVVRTQFNLSHRQW